MAKEKGVLESVAEEMDLKRRYPGYFNPWFFRGVYIILIVLFIVAMKSQNWDTEKHLYISCPADNSGPCLNPFFVCNKALVDNPGGYVNIQEPGLASFCASVGELPEPCPVCELEYINPGESMGKAPPAYIEYFWFYAFLLLALAFAFNHLAYLRRQKRKSRGGD